MVQKNLLRKQTQTELFTIIQQHLAGANFNLILELALYHSLDFNADNT